MSAVFFSGFILSFSLILVIGAQNAFVLKQGIRREYVMAVCLTCAFSDAILIAFGVSAFREIINYIPLLESFARVTGAVYLCIYGLRNLYSAWKATGSLIPFSGSQRSLGAILVTCLALTWLNPHVYLDTVFLISSVSTNYSGAEIWFAFGAIVASFLFFFSLGYGAGILRPIFMKPNSWRVLELIVGIIMLCLALHLLVR